MFAQSNFTLQNIAENDGIAIAVTGMLIVFLALTLITTFIAALPRILQRLEGILPAEHDHHQAAAPRAAPDDEAVAVAIGFALRSRLKSKSQ